MTVEDETVPTARVDVAVVQLPAPSAEPPIATVVVASGLTETPLMLKGVAPLPACMAKLDGKPGIVPKFGEEVEVKSYAVLEVAVK